MAAAADMAAPAASPIRPAPPSSRPLAIEDVSLSARAGELVGLVGAVGSGKTSLISALLGDVPRVNGSLLLRGRLAIAAQRPFILSDTLRENVCFGREYEPDWYAQVIAACQLDVDMTQLAAGDLTRIGERGVMLSGGQRARVALARAVYARAPVVLLDDPLAACDPRLAADIVESVIGPRGLLNESLRVLSTSQLEALREADQVLVMRQGRVAEHGTYAALREKQGGVFLRLLNATRLAEKRAADAEAHAATEDKPTANIDAATSAGTSVAASAESSASSTSIVGGGRGLVEAGKGALTSGEPLAAAAYPTSADGTVGVTALAAALTEDARVVGTVKLRVFGAWLAAAGGLSALALALLPLIGAELILIGSSLWLTRWSSSTVATTAATATAAATESARQLHHLCVFAGWAFAAAAAVVVRSRLILGLGLRAGRRLHDQMLERVVRAPVGFIETQPVGRLLSRFGAEQRNVDVGLPGALQSYGTTMVSVATTLCFVCGTSPVFGAAVLPIGLVYASIQRFYSQSARELTRIVAATRAPVLSQVVNTLDGLSTIRAFGVTRAFTQQGEARLDQALRASIFSSFVNCWLGLRLELLGSLITAAAALAAFGRNSAAALGVDVDVQLSGRLGGRLGSALLGALRGAGGVGASALAVTLAVQLTQTLNWTVRQACEVEAQFTAVERLRSYSSLAPEPGYAPPRPGELGSAEPGYTPPADMAAAVAREAAAATAAVAAALETAAAAEQGAAPRTLPPPTAALETAAAAEQGPAPRTLPPPHSPSPSAPATGGSALELRSLSLRYDEALPLALRGVSVRVRPGEKVGVVGRSGAGKSSLVAALTRLVVPPLRSGEVLLDGQDISTIPLHEHRRSIVIIPQEPTLFAGSVRSNLDPLDIHDDDALWAAIHRVQLAHMVHSLDVPVAEDGASLSAGQRQLLCIARATLAAAAHTGASGPGLVILDEATSAVDAETDALIQRAVRAAFRDATVLTIAHRLDSVLDSDKIIVLEGGALVELGAPRELIGRSRGHFRRMINAVNGH